MAEYEYEYEDEQKGISTFAVNCNCGTDIDTDTDTDSDMDNFFCSYNCNCDCNCDCDCGFSSSATGNLKNNIFAGDGKSSGDQTFNFIGENGVDLGKAWYNASKCYENVGPLGLRLKDGRDIGTLLGKYGTLHCVDIDIDQDIDQDSDSDTDGSCLIAGNLLTKRGLIDVSEIAVGDYLWGQDEKWHQVIGVCCSTIGSRKAYRVSETGMVTSDHVLVSGQAQYVPCLETLNKCRQTILCADNNVKGMYPVASDVRAIDSAELIDLSPDTRTFSPICDDGCVAYLDDVPVLIAKAI